MNCKLHWYPKFYNSVILFVGFLLWVLDSLVFILSISNFNLQIRLILFCFIGNVYQFIVHCLIPLDPCKQGKPRTCIGGYL